MEWSLSNTTIPIRERFKISTSLSFKTIPKLIIFCLCRKKKTLKENKIRRKLVIKNKEKKMKLFGDFVKKVNPWSGNKNERKDKAANMKTTIIQIHTNNK
jgi:hypothetical protein